MVIFHGKEMGCDGACCCFIHRLSGNAPKHNQQGEENEKSQFHNLIIKGHKRSKDNHAKARYIFGITLQKYLKNRIQNDSFHFYYGKGKNSYFCPNKTESL